MSACAATSDPDLEAEAGFKPLLLPVKFTLTESGIKVSGDRSLVTPIGVFSIGAKYSLPYRETDAIYVTIRDRKEPPQGFDHTYKVRSGRGEFTAVVNGSTTIQIKDRHVLIDVTDAKVQSIEFKSTQPVAVPAEDNVYVQRWDSFWEGVIYKPFALSSWAYDDSTVTKWYGLGFAWFLLRLLLALILLIPDVLITIVVVLAGIADTFFGATVRNIIYGLAALIALLFLIPVIFGIVSVANDRARGY